MKDSTPPLVHSQRQITIPSPDIVTYAFAAYGKYDLDKPVGREPHKSPLAKTDNDGALQDLRRWQRRLQFRIGAHGESDSEAVDQRSQNAGSGSRGLCVLARVQ